MAPEDLLSRAFFRGPEFLDDTAHFNFNLAGEYAESMYWRRLAPQIEDVHSRGCAIERKNRAKRPDAWARYIGARSITAQTVTSIRSERGRYTFVVEHVPNADDQAHTHISIRIVGAEGAKLTTKLQKNDRLEIIEKLMRALSPLEPHSCAQEKLPPVGTP